MWSSGHLYFFGVVRGYVQALVSYSQIHLDDLLKHCNVSFMRSGSFVFCHWCAPMSSMMPAPHRSSGIGVGWLKGRDVVALGLLVSWRWSLSVVASWLEPHSLPPFLQVPACPHWLLHPPSSPLVSPFQASWDSTYLSSMWIWSGSLSSITLSLASSRRREAMSSIEEGK